MKTNKTNKESETNETNETNETSSLIQRPSVKAKEVDQNSEVQMKEYILWWMGFDQCFVGDEAKRAHEIYTPAELDSQFEQIIVRAEENRGLSRLDAMREWKASIILNEEEPPLVGQLDLHSKEQLNAFMLSKEGI